MKHVVIVSEDPILLRVFPTLLASSDPGVSWFDSSAGGIASSKVRCPDAMLLDCRFGFRGPVLEYLSSVGSDALSLPAIILYQGDGVVVPGSCNAPQIVASIDARGSTLKSLLERIGSACKAAFARAQTVPGSVEGHADAASHVEVWSNHVAGRDRVATGRFGSAPAAGKLRWHELYRDERLLIEETRATSGGVATSPEGRPAAVRLERRLSRADAVKRLVEYSQARPLKSTVRLALQVARDSTATVEDLAGVVKQDQGLAARVLQTANCSLHRRGAAVRTIEQAIVRLGVAALRETISSTTVLEQFGDDAGVLNVPLLWEHGYAVGMLGADLARCTRATPPDDAFMIGLLHDMGRAVMAHEFGQDYVDALIEARRQDVRPAGIEKQFFEINHADVADALFATWDFDEAITAPIANHHLSEENLKHLAPVHVRQTKLLQAADTLAHASLLGDSGSDWIDSTCLDLGGSPISPGLVRTCVDRANKTLDELRLLNASMSVDPPMSYADRVREQVGGQARLEGLDKNDTMDLMAMLAWRLKGGKGAAGDVPVLLGTIQTGADVEVLREAIARYDKAGTGFSAVLSVASDALVKLVRVACEGRPLEVLPRVYRVAWVVRGVNRVLADPCARGQAVA